MQQPKHLYCSACGAEIEGSVHELDALIESEQRLAFALEAGGLGSWELDLTTKQLVHSDICRVNFGLLPYDTIENYDDLVRRIHPDDRIIQSTAVEQAIKTKSALNFEYRALHPDGQVDWIEIRGHAIYNAQGAPVKMSGVSINITFRKRVEERQRRLLDELNHRVKNTLATVQSIATQTERNAQTPAAFTVNLTARLAALARAHDLLTEESWDGASLAAVISQSLKHYDDMAGRIEISGAPVRLLPNAAVTLNMAFYELTTNSVKFGALSTRPGQISVRWHIVPQPNGSNYIEICWQEADGPPVQPPDRRGFGRRLLEQGVSGELGGEVQLLFEATGVCCRMCLPLSEKIVLAG
jgi:two-component sensor histidine kinase